MHRYGEAIDDHQIPFGRRLAASGLVTFVDDLTRLSEVLAQHGNGTVESPFGPSEVLVEELSRLIEATVSRGAAPMPDPTLASDAWLRTGRTHRTRSSTDSLQMTATHSRPPYDAVLIGTGPPMLLEGLWRAEAGQRVVFVDRASEIGGSWRTPAVLGHRNVELGVHLIENRPHLNALLKNLLRCKRADAPATGFWLTSWSSRAHKTGPDGALRAGCRQSSDSMEQAKRASTRTTELAHRTHQLSACRSSTQEAGSARCSTP